MNRYLAEFCGADGRKEWRIFTAADGTAFCYARTEAQRDAVLKMLNAWPDMVWHHDDGERFAHCIGDAVGDYINEDGPIPVGSELKLDTGYRGDTVTVRITAVPDEEGDGPIEWELVTPGEKA